MILNSLNNISKYQAKNLNVIIILFSWILLWAAIGSKPANITEFLYHVNIWEDLRTSMVYELIKTSTFSIIFNFLRSISPLFIIFIVLFLICRSKTEAKPINHINAIILFFFIYTIFQFIGFFLSYLTDTLPSGTHSAQDIFVSWTNFIEENTGPQTELLKELNINTKMEFWNDWHYIEAGIKELYWILLVISSLSIFYMIEKESNQFLYKNLFYLTVVIILLISLVSIFPVIIEFISTKKSLYYNKSLGQRGVFDLAETPNASGLSRMFLISYIVSIVSFFFLETSKSKKYFIFVISCLFSFLVIVLQSRASIVGFIIVNFILFLFLNIKLSKKVFIFIIIFIVPFFLKSQFTNFVQSKILKVTTEEIIEYKKKDLASLSSTDKLYHSDRIKIFKKGFEGTIEAKRKYKELFKAGERIPEDVIEKLNTDISTGRFYDWVTLFEYSKSKPFFGYGPLADRFLIGSTASNAFVYALICSGYFGVICILLLCFSAFFDSLVLIFKYKVFRNLKNVHLISSILILSFLLFRGLVESSFAVYGTDFLLFLISAVVIKNEKKTLQKLSL